MDYLHQNNIIHRDIKLENILYVHGGKHHGTGRVKLIDFGTACKVTLNTELTEVFGTPNYIAPEMLDRRYDFKADVWSIGIICTKLITGKMPFEANSEKQLFQNIKTKTINYQSALKQNKSIHCIDFMKRCLYKNPD